MKRMRGDSRIEVWSAEYVNDPNARRYYHILQIEPADVNGDKFLVEALCKEDTE